MALVDKLIKREVLNNAKFWVKDAQVDVATGDVVAVAAEYKASKAGGAKEAIYLIDTVAGSGLDPFYTDDAGKTALGL